VREVDGSFQLLKGEDGTKDQSYFLYRLNQAQLANTLFPVGHLYKREVRRIARELKLPNCTKKDSTGICFIGERPFREFLNRYLPHEPGEIQTPDGKVIGQHLGLMYYTIGQRQGLGIGGTRDGGDEPWFVSAKDMARNILVAVQGHDHPDLLRPSLKATDLTWISGKQPHCNWVYAAKTRYRQTDAPCAISQLTRNHCQVDFAQDQWAVTPGQSVVIYESKVCLGGGIIVG
jgi:tRNA-specific 2-thiouridylase